MNRKEAKKLAEVLVAQMTVDEMASQLRFDAPAIPRLGIPAYNWWNEGLHGLARSGTATVFPQAIGMAAMFDPELLQQIGGAVAEEARAKYNAVSAEGDRDIYKGLTIWSPNVNIFRDPRWGRGHETYGEDPYLTSVLGVAYVHGLQGNGEHLKTAACAKHFAVHSGPEDLRHSFDAIASPKDMHETYLPAFQELVDAGVESVMGAYNRINGEPACATGMLQHLLRDQWGFEGHVVSDCWAVRDFHEGHHVTETAEESASLAMKAGCDLNCGCTYQNIMAAYELGMLDRDTIANAAVRVLTTRYLLGILGEGSEYDTIPYTVVESPEHLALARKAARESFVLLKNNGILPLDPKSCGTVAVIGPNANSRSSLDGNYHGTASRYVTVLEGIQDHLEKTGNRVLYSQGCSLDGSRVEPLALPNDRLAEAIVCAKNGDTVILVVGLDETLEGEEGDEGNSYRSGDKKDLLLPQSQRILLDAILGLHKPTIVVLLAGSSVDLSAAQESADGILLGWYPGAQGGKAAAELIFGEAAPSGKLPVTFYRNEALEEMPDFTDYSMEGRTYRYYQGKPLYPFGYGLTYSEFCILESTVDMENHIATARVKNTGKTEGGNVLQVYVKDTESPYAPPNPVLCGFQRIYLQAGEEAKICVRLNKNTFTVIDHEGNRIPGSGAYDFTVSFGS